MKTLIIDNYDSFTFNLYQYLAELGGNPTVVKNDDIDLDGVREFGASHVVISPGPGRPGRLADFGVCSDIIREMCGEVPILGVCLGCQGIAEVFGGSVVQAPEIMHGKRSKIKIGADSKLFVGLNDEFEAMRYHSLVVDKHSLPDFIEVTCSTLDNDLVMGLQHRGFDLFGVQFHPESIGTDAGKKILENFLSV